ncbi:hypothetical protein C0J52_13305 [Blattella germanica]|nr:hypothetical protein C0J52_13305 [Blattella germanica]
MSMFPLRSRCFSDLPDEITTEIFSYLNLEDLAYTVPKVSTKWEELSQDYTIWKNKVFTPTDDMETKEIIKLLKHMPALKSFSGGNLSFHDVNLIIDTIRTSCKDLESIYLKSEPTVSVSNFNKLVEALPQLKELSIPFSHSHLEGCSLPISKLQSLTHVTFVEDRPSGYIPSSSMTQIADGCSSLKHVNFQSSAFDKTSIEYFLRKKQKQLVSLKIQCILSPSAFNCIVECENLKNLICRCYFKANMEPENIIAMQKLKKLERLDLHLFSNKLSKAVPDLFQTGALSRVTKLRLEVDEFNASDLNQVIMCSPQLTTFHIRVRGEVDFDEALKNIGNCRNLSKLVLENSNGVSGKCLDRVAESCPNLRSLGVPYTTESGLDLTSSIKMKKLDEVTVHCKQRSVDDNPYLLPNLDDFFVVLKSYYKQTLKTNIVII